MSQIIVSLSPHAHGTDSVEKNMYGVVIALLPALLASFYFFGIGSLIVCAAGCNGSQSGTTQSDTETTTAKAETTAAAEVTAEAVKATEGTTMKVENQSFKYRPGDIITFGKYEQDNKKSNGKEDIEWIVLAREGNKVLVLSRYALASKPYNNKKTDVTWETCSLRKWLDKDFGLFI